MLTRRCVGRLTSSSGSRSCMNEGIHVGKDGKFRCKNHHAVYRGKPKPPEVDERECLEREDET